MTSLTALSLPVAARARAVGAGGAVTVTGEGNTLASIAADIDNPALFRLEGKRAVCAGAFTLNGGLRMGPGESLAMENPEGEWARRLVYLLGGPMEFEDCAIEGAYWIHVGPEARGTWRGVRLISGENALSGYPLLYFESAHVDWNGGLLDANPSPARFTPYALFPRGGYFPGSFRNTIRNIAIRARRAAIFDPADNKGNTVDLTFEGCRVEAEEAVLASNVNVSDGASTKVTFLDCRFAAPPVFALTGSAVEVVVVEEGKRTVHRAPELVRLGEGGAHDLGVRLRSEVSGLAATLRRLEAKDALRGSLYWPRVQLGKLERIQSHLTSAGWYGPADVQAVERLEDAVRDMAAKLPQTLQRGSAYRPLPSPVPPSPSGGVAHVTLQGESGVRVENGERTIIHYDGRGSEASRARITEESTIRGRRIFEAYPGLGGPSLRHAAPTESAVMLWEQPWRVEVVQTATRIVGFKATQRHFKRIGSAVTQIFFYDLPDVILFDVESIQRGAETPQPPRARFQAYSDMARGAYNGLRFWSLDPAGIKRSYGAAATDTVFAGDPVSGVFVTGPGEWYHPTLTKGMLVAQWNGYNDWEKNPPCGFIFRPEGQPMLWANASGYFAPALDLPPPVPTLEPQRHRVLWFEGWGLKCWENLFNLEAAFNHPCRLEPVRLRVGAEPVVSLAEADGLRRAFEIVVLPGAFNRIQTKRDLFRGDSTVFLLRDIAAGARVTLGTLPIRLEASGAGRFRCVSALSAPLSPVLVSLDIAPEVRVTGLRHAGRSVTDWQRIGATLTYVAEVAPGETEIVVEGAGPSQDVTRAARR